jgi:predicted transcriptional regulator
MKVLMSIKPEYLTKIQIGVKRFEFRRKIFKRRDIAKIVVYVSGTVRKVVGELEIEYILCLQTSRLWNETRYFSGVTKKLFLDYFRDVEYGYAIKIKQYIHYPIPQDLKTRYNISPPQSFRYIND